MIFQSHEIGVAQLKGRGYANHIRVLYRLGHVGADFNLEPGNPLELLDRSLQPFGLGVVSLDVDQHPLLAQESSRSSDARYGAVEEGAVLGKDCVELVSGVLVADLEHHARHPAVGGDRSTGNEIGPLELSQNMSIWGVFDRSISETFSELDTQYFNIRHHLTLNCEARDCLIN